MARTSALPSQATSRVQRALVPALLVLIFAVGAYRRWHNADIWPSGYHETRQYYTALNARQVWLHLRPAPISDGEAKWLEKSPTTFIEPPIFEGIMACVYVVLGRETPSACAWVASAFWFAGAWFVFDTAKRLVSSSLGGTLALGIYLLSPASILLSRIFQPEPLMVFAFCVAVWWLAKTSDRRRLQDVIVSGVICAAAAFVKPGPSLFLLAAGYLGLSIAKMGLAALVDYRVYLFSAIMALPSVAYAWLLLDGHLQAKVIPSLLLTSDFYFRTWALMESSVGWMSILGAVVGASYLAFARRNGLALGLLVGHIAFCGVFTYHTMTHHYYHALLVVVVALSVAPLASVVEEALDRTSAPQAGLIVLLFLAAMVRYSAEDAFVTAERREFLAARRELAQQIEQAVGTGSTVIMFGPDNGEWLEFDGWLDVESWPLDADIAHARLAGGTVETSVDAQLDSMIRVYEPSHVVVLAIQRQPDPALVQLLESRYQTIHAEDLVSIYQLPASAQ